MPNNHLAKPTLGFLLFNVVLDLLEGISIVWLYAALRPVYGLGVRTAVIAAVAVVVYRQLGRCNVVFLRVVPSAYSSPTDDWDVASARPRDACRNEVLQGVNIRRLVRQL